MQEGEPPERDPVDLARAGEGQLRHEDDVARMLKRRRMGQRVLLHRVFAEPTAVPGHHERERLFVLDLVGDGHHAGLHDVRMPLEQRLDLARVNVLAAADERSEEHTSELQSRRDLVCRLLLEKKKKKKKKQYRKKKQ